MNNKCFEPLLEMKLLILITSFLAVYCRPHTQDGNSPQPIKFDRLDLSSSTRNAFTKSEQSEMKDTTSEILRKIQQVNLKHGYTTRRPIRKEYQLLPHFYTYSHQHSKPLRRITNSKNDEDSTSSANTQTDRMQQHGDFTGQRVKRKITHEQNYFVPPPVEPPIVQYLMMVPLSHGIPVQPYNRYNHVKQIYNPNYNKNADNSLIYLEQQMLDNLKSIILKSQLPPNIEGITFNPLVQELPHENSFVQYRKPDMIYGSSGYINNIPSMPWNVYQYEGYTPDKQIEAASLKPLALYNSLTTITEYDNEGEKCKTTNQIVNANLRSGKSQLLNRDALGPRYSVDVDKSIEVAAFTEEDSPQKTVLFVHQENPHNTDDPQTREMDENKSSKEFGNNRIEKVRKISKPTNSVNQNSNEDDEKTLNPVKLFLLNQQNKNQPTTAPPETEKDTINENSKKVLSKDNTGSGIFIHRLKVRKGGVAIAGPGGIATAGSGGTAIVGPNGFAYTHPDSLAIAGTGSKVIAVDPAISLGDIVKGKQDASRAGRVVAVGPVIYYNKG